MKLIGSLVVILLAALFGYIYIYKKRFQSEKARKVIKYVLYIAFAVITFIKIGTEDNFRTVANFANSSISETENLDVYSYNFIFWIVWILRLLTQGCVLSLCVSGYFNNKNGKRINAFIAPIVYLLDAILIIPYSKSFALETQSHAVFSYITILFEILFALCIGIYEINELKEKNELKVEKNEIGKLIGQFCFCMWLAIYNCFACNIFGFIPVQMQMFTPIHIILLVIPVVLYIIYSNVLKKKDLNNKKYFLQLLAVGLTLRHFYLYTFEELNFIPLALCHIGTILIPLAIATRNKPIMGFCLTDSVVGALFALIVPTGMGSNSIIGSGAIHFMSNHVDLVIIPILAVTCGYFQDLKFKDLKKVILVNIGFWATVVIFSLFFPNHSWFFFNNTELIELVSVVVNLMPIRNNFVLEFSLFGIQAKAYYLYWLLMLMGLNLVTLIGYGIYKLEILLCNINIKKKEA